MNRLNETYLCLSDLQIPYEHSQALDLARYVKRHYRISDDNVLCVGDEVDSLHGGQYPKGADYNETPRGELKIARMKIQEWAGIFPKMRLAVSNHGLRWVRKASNAEIPTELLRDYHEIIGAPDGWKWADQWKINASRHPFWLTHGMQFGGMYAFRNAPIQMGGSVVFGHLHSSAGIAYIESDGFKAWGFNTGSLIDREAYAFKYAKYNKWKANLGLGVIAQGGLMPIWIPMPE